MNPASSSADDTLRRLLGHLAEVREAIESPETRRRADILLSGARNLDKLRDAERQDYRVAVQAFCHRNDLQRVLIDSGVAHAYNYREEYPQEPQNGSGAEVVQAVPQRTLLGRPVGFPLGVPASVLTADSRWVRFFAARGFNVLTFKTVRSREWNPNPFPNWVFLEDADEPLPLGTNLPAVTVHGDEDTYLRRLRAFSTANSFGVPSSDPSVWGPEVRAAVEVLGEGQMIIVSVMGTVRPEDPPEALLKDFVAVSRMAADAGAPAIELNLSCPNTLDPNATDAGVKPPLCGSVEDTVKIVAAVAAELGGAIPLVAKLSYLPLPDLAPLVRAINPYVQAVSGINTLQVRVERPRGQPTFDERQLAGLSGIAIRRLAVDFVRSLHHLRRNEHELDFEIIGIGGVMDVPDVYALLAVGADAVQTATAASVNPSLPLEIADPHLAGVADDETVERVRTMLYDDDGRFRSPRALAELLDLPTDAVERELNPLGELDLPRRVFELLAVDLGGSRAEPHELDLEIWGPPPAPERIAAIQRTTEHSLEREHEHVRDRSLPPDIVAERLGWSAEQVQTALDDGPLVYHEWSGRRTVPLWQFEEQDGTLVLLPGVAELKQAFARDVVALNAWVNTPNPTLGRETPRDALRAGQIERVLRSLVSIGAAR